MLKVLFFASVKEQLNCASLELQWSDRIGSLDALQQSLCDERGEHWRSVLGQNNMIRAVNQVVIDSNADLSDGDEVAFFPPVTGG